MSTAPGATIDLYWLPLGAGGHFVRFNGRVYEAIHARRERRPALDLYHTALEVTVPEGRFVVENAWPIPDSHPENRGVTIQGPVWSTYLGQFRIFRYEVRCWLDGTIPDLPDAVASPQRVSDDEQRARALLAAAKSVPRYVWGRDELRIGEMWNSNSVISWLLTVAGLPAFEIRPPVGGRAPGWMTGVLAAEQAIRISQIDPSRSVHNASPSLLAFFSAQADPPAEDAADEGGPSEVGSRALRAVAWSLDLIVDLDSSAQPTHRPKTQPSFTRTV